MKTRKLLSALFALMLVVTMFGANAKADEAATTYDLSEAKMIKTLEVADGIDIEAVKEFAFSFTGKDGTGTTAAEAAAAVTAQQTITVGAQTDGKAEGELALSDVFNASRFPHAGEFVYEVKETTTAFDENGKTLTVDSSIYTVRVYVINGANGLEILGLTVEKGGEKVDPTADGKGFKFENTYKEELESEDGVLTVTKSITGNYADKTKKFPVSVTLTLPSLATAADVEVAEGVTWNAETLTASAELADGDTIKFTKLPAGTTFTVSETQDAAYKSKITGDVKTPDTDYVAGNRTNVEGKEPITAAGVEVSVENNREDIIPTGIIINNLPYILIVAVAMFGAAYLALKKRARNF